MKTVKPRELKNPREAKNPKEIKSPRTPARKGSFFDEYAKKAVTDGRRKDGDLAAAVGLLGKVGDLSAEMVRLRGAEKERVKERDEAKNEAGGLKKQVKSLKKSAILQRKLEVTAAETQHRSTLLWSHQQTLITFDRLFEWTKPVPKSTFTAIHDTQDEENCARSVIVVGQAEDWREILVGVRALRTMGSMAADHKTASQVASLRAALVKLEISDIEKSREVRNLKGQIAASSTSPVLSSQAITPESHELLSPPQHLLTSPPITHIDALRSRARVAGIAQARALLGR
eukprot:TRINITY_DN3647_c0_g2_i1.p1 TRINITY_DN3647_c0_g2~~TRINITY_DN3647_c0_g2_i1.p1  ORF type:complete len:287 (+),score=57.98 TRINITY_DN3647_c0_g2_i1:40-900(+)